MTVPLWTTALDLLFPPKCPFCQRVLDDPKAPLCPQCQPALPWLEGKEACRKVEHTAGCWSPLEYKEQTVDAIHRYKFCHTPALGAPLGLLMAQCVRDHGEITPDVITWAPLSGKRRRSRGYDQAFLLARAVGEELSLPVEPLLVKARHTAPQSDLYDHAARRANAQGAYALRSSGAGRGRRVLLVDDVVTSGSTLRACAQVLREAGAAEIWCLTLARAGK